MSLADYLAKNYLSADTPARTKPKKRQRQIEASAGLIIADDDDASWKGGHSVRDEEDDPISVNGRSGEFRRTSKSNWKSIGTTAPSNAEQAAADAILASAAAESKTHVPEDNEPLVVNSTRATGLQTAASLAAAASEREALERQQIAAINEASGDRAHETIYRDASGRIINVALKRAEARRKMEEEERRKVEESMAQKGDVQRLDRERRRQELEEAEYLGVSRYADDVDLNAELKGRQLWSDPALGFLSKGKAGTSATGKPLYRGAAPPNRYGIRPGYRWDGVDRSNGFEKEYFAAQSKRNAMKDLQYAWQLDE